MNMVFWKNLQSIKAAKGEAQSGEGLLYLRHSKFFGGASGAATLTYLGAGAATSLPVHFIQAEDLEGGERRGSRLGGDHPPEAGHGPGADVVVVSANWRARQRR